MANKKPLYIENGRIQEFGSGDTISATIAPGSGGGGGGSVSVEQNGVEIVSGASVLNFTGSVTVTDAGGGQANINISGGGGGGVPTIVQKKIVAVSNIAAGVTLDSAPTQGNILVALCLNSTGTGVPGTASGWTNISSNTSLPDHIVVTKKAGPSEAALQTPTSTNEGGVIIIYEVSGTVAISPSIGTTASVASVNIPFTTNNEYQPAATGLLIGFSARRTDETGTTWSGTLTKDLEIAGAAATTGGTGVSATSATGTLILNGAPSSSCIWPTSAATLGQFVLVA